MKKFLKYNSLSIVFIFLFLTALIGRVYFGFEQHNQELSKDGALPITLAAYFSSGHFRQSTFENWESEFLQMALFVILTIFLKQKGYSESKGFDGEEEVDREPSPAKRMHHGP